MYSRNVGSVHRQKESMSGPHSESEYADMAELADAHGSGPCEGSFMKVRILLSAPKIAKPRKKRGFVLPCRTDAAGPHE